MKVIIVGATGFIGKKLAKRCIEEGYEVLCIGRALHKISCFSDSARLIHLDILDRERIKEVFAKEKPDILFHCAAHTRNTSMRTLRRVNVEGTRNVLDACVEAKVKKVIYLSTISVICGNATATLNDDLPYSPLSIYGISKIEAEQLAIAYREKGIKIAILRPTLVYGESEPHWLYLLVNLLRIRLLPILGKGENRYPLVYVENLIDVMMLAVINEAAYKGTYIVSDKEAVTIKELFTFVSKTCGFRSPLHLPRFIALFLVKMPFIKGNFRIFTENKVCNIENLKEEFGYIPRVSFYSGMFNALGSYKKDGLW